MAASVQQALDEAGNAKDSANTAESGANAMVSSINQMIDGTDESTGRPADGEMLMTCL